MKPEPASGFQTSPFIARSQNNYSACDPWILSNKNPQATPKRTRTMHAIAPLKSILSALIIFSFWDIFYLSPDADITFVGTLATSGEYYA